MVKDIILYPNNMLRSNSMPVTNFGETVKQLIEDLKDTCSEHQGAGLAAVQIGIPLRAFVILDGGEYVFMANPEWRPLTNIEEEMHEGCLSFPGMFETVSRYPIVGVEFDDEHGDSIYREYEGIAAQAVQHECDHLVGLLFSDKLDVYHKERFLNGFRKQMKRVKTP